MITDVCTIRQLLRQAKPGERLQMSCENGETKLYATYIGIIQDLSIILTTPEIHGKTAFIKPGQCFDLSVIIEGFGYKWRSMVVQSYAKPYPYLHMSYPASLQRFNMREAQRVTTLVPATAISERPFSDGSNTAACHIVDISIGGASVVAPVTLGISGELLVLQVSFASHRGERTEEALNCVIRNVRSCEHQCAHGVISHHGVEFRFSSDEQKHVAHEYVSDLLGFAATVHFV
ncbi:MAG: flagellar brake protein [Methylococcaceae bacterium]|nr:MAG: flagellar brake protein [Methylococcaceae bacterium]